MIIQNSNGLGGSLNVTVNDRSYRFRQIMGEDSLYLYFSMPNYINIAVGAYVDYQATRYYLHKPDHFKKHHSRNYEYSLVLTSEIGSLNKYKMRDSAEKRLKFPFTAKPQQHLQMLVDNLNERESGWAVGACIDAPEKLISYNHTSLNEALQMIADAFETEWEVKDKTIHLKKVEYNYINPLALSYGKGNGFKPGIGRSNVDEKSAIEILHVQGGERNIDYSKYGNKELLLPIGQTYNYEGRTYVVSADGRSIQRSSKPIVTGVEDSLDASHIYPQRVGEVSEVVVVNAAKHLYDFKDASIPANLDFDACQIAGEKMTVVFQTGILAGREFDIDSYVHASRLFRLVPQEQDGMHLPDNIFKPVPTDKYAVFGIQLPAAYIRDDATKTGASWDLFKEAVKYFYEHETPRFTFTGELDGIWAKQDWLNIGGKIVLGGFVNFSDPQFFPAGELIRIVGVKDYVNNPYSPEIELSNTPISGGFMSEIGKIKAQEVVTNELYRQSISYAKRGYQDSIQTMEMLQEAFKDTFTNAISPVTVKTMALLVGDESLQFRFVNNTTTPVEIVHSVTFNPATKKLNAPAGIIQHMTLGLDTISSAHTASEYKFWNVPNFDTPPLVSADKSYYLYIKANKANTTAVFYISESPIELEAVAGYYHFLMGILNSESDDDRSYVSLYGFTEITPGRITTNKIVSADGNTFFDLQTGDIQGKFTFTSGKKIEDAIHDAVNDLEIGGTNLLNGTHREVVTYTKGNQYYWYDKYITASELSSWGVVVGSYLTINVFLDKPTINARVDLRFQGSNPKNHNGNLITAGTSGWSTVTVQLTSLELEGLSLMAVSITGTNVAATTGIGSMKLEIGNKATAWSPSSGDVTAEIASAKQEALTAAGNAQSTANSANTAVGTLSGYVDGAFKDGVIDAAEAKAIEKYKNTLNEAMAKAESSYLKVYTNTYLSGASKTALQNAKINLWGQRDTLIGAINTAIAGGTTTASQKLAVDNAFGTFNTLMGAFQNALEEANKAIQVKLDNISKGYVDDLEIGGTNLLKNTASGVGWSKTDFDAETRTFTRETTGTSELFVVLIEQTRLENNTTYTLSAWIRSNGQVKDVDYFVYNKSITKTHSKTYIPVTTNWQFVTFTFTTDSSTDYSESTIRFDNNGSKTAGVNAILYVKEPKLERGTKATDWSPNPEDVPSALDYLATAIQDGSTDIEGGLVSTNVLKVKDTSGAVTGGMSGLSNDNVGFWTGGSYQDALDSLAKVLFRKDGSGQLAGGIVKFSELGDTDIGDIKVGASGELGIYENQEVRVLLSRQNISTLSEIASATQDSKVDNESMSLIGVVYEYQYYNQPKGVVTVMNNTPTNVIGSFSIGISTSSGFRLSQGRATITVFIGLSSQNSIAQLGSATVQVDKLSGEAATNNSGIINFSRNVNLPVAGTYRIYAKIHFEGIGNESASTERDFYIVQGFLGDSSMHAKKDAAKRITEIGKNGVGIISDANNYSFFGVENGVYKIVDKTTGVYDRPGVLLAGRMESGSVSKYWGAKYRAGSYREGNNIYRIHHNIGHVDYSVQLTPQLDARMWVLQRATTYCRVQASVATLDFDFAMFGDNK